VSSGCACRLAAEDSIADPPGPTGPTGGSPQFGEAVMAGQARRNGYSPWRRCQPVRRIGYWSKLPLDHPPILDVDPLRSGAMLRPGRSPPPLRQVQHRVAIDRYDRNRTPAVPADGLSILPLFGHLNRGDDGRPSCRPRACRACPNWANRDPLPACLWGRLLAPSPTCRRTSRNTLGPARIGPSFASSFSRYFKRVDARRQGAHSSIKGVDHEGVGIVARPAIGAR